MMVNTGEKDMKYSSLGAQELLRKFVILSEPKARRTNPIPDSRLT